MRSRGPGNVRELRNVLSRASAMAQDGIIRRADVAGEGFGFRGTRQERDALDLSGTFSTAKERAVELSSRRAYLAALIEALCRQPVARLGARRTLARHHLRDLLKKRGLYGVSWPDDGDGEP